MTIIVNLIVALFMVVLTHEIGHLFLSVYYGFDVHHFVVGPFAFKLKDKKRTFYLEHNYHLWGGVCTVSGDDMYQYSKILIAGPMFTLLSGLMALMLYIFSSKNLFLLVSIFSILSTTMNLIPVKKGLFYNDCGRWLNIKKNKDEFKLEKVTLNIIKSFYNHGDYSKLEIEEIEALISSCDINIAYIGHYYLMKFYQDNYYYEEVERQKQYMSKLALELPKAYVKYMTQM